MENWTTKLSGDTHQLVDVVDPNGIVIRQIFNKPTTEQSKKDAALIAAAPEMLASLKEALIVIEHVTAVHKEENTIWDIINNAIKLAEDAT